MQQSLTLLVQSSHSAAQRAHPHNWEGEDA